MDTLNICWRGNPGTGKKTTLHKRLKEIASIRNLPFTIQTKYINGAGGGIEDDEANEGSEHITGEITYEVSNVHMGFDISRMSMQDKQYLRPILLNLGQGSQVLSGTQGRGARIVVFYHAHLLSSESVLLIQACLEQNEFDISVWMTSEMPVPYRIRDWFVEIPVSGHDFGLEKYSEKVKTNPATWSTIFKALIDKWLKLSAPTIDDIKEVKFIVYEILMRNFRWVEAVHYLLDTLINHDTITERQRKICIQALADCDATSGGYTIPSYRIPIIWEGLFIKFRNVLHKD
jgi:hypothetical protein